MAGLKPFEGAANRTAIIILQRGRATRYPVRYNCWYKPGGGSVIPEDTILEDVTKLRVATYREFVAQPVDDADLTSSWITGREPALKSLAKLRGPSDYRAHAGVYTGGANAVYWLEVVGMRPDGLVVVNNLTEGAKRVVDSIQTAIEPRLVYPLMRGRDVQRWSALPSAHILLPHTQETLWKPIELGEMQLEYPRTYAYLRNFEAPLLQRRSGWYQQAKERLPFYTVFSVGVHTFAPYKVAWRYIASEFMCSVLPLAEHGTLGVKPAIPDHRLMLVPLETAEEAHYVCAMLNSVPARYLVQSYFVETQISTHILTNLRVPRYVRGDPAHAGLSVLSQQAHAATAAGDTARVREIEAEIDQLAARLWGLTDAELKEIQESLAELG